VARECPRRGWTTVSFHARVEISWRRMENTGRRGGEIDRERAGEKRERERERERE